MSGRIRAHATVWGIDPPHARAGAADAISAADYDVRSLNILEPGSPCLFDLEHHAVYASRQRPGWTWILHDPMLPPPLTPAGRDTPGPRV